MRNSFRPGIRSWLVLLTVVAMAPGLAMVSCLASKQRDEAAKDLETNLDLTALIAQERVRAELDRAHGALEALAHLSEVRGGDEERCSAVARDVAARFPAFANVGVSTSKGEIFCSAMDFPPGLRNDDRSYFARAVRSGDFAIGEYAQSRILGRPVLHLAHSIRDEEGSIHRVVWAAYELEHLRRALAGASTDRDKTLTLVDGEGTILARFPDHGIWVGKRPNLPIVSQLLTMEPGVAEDVGLDGVRRLYAFRPLQVAGTDSGLVVAAGVPRARALAPLDRRFKVSLAMYTAIAALGLAAAWALGEFAIARRVAKLSAAAGRVASGDLRARSGLRGKDTIGQLGKAFDEMASALAERQHLEMKLRQAQKMEAVGRLAGGVAHDFNNLLTVILAAGHDVAEQVQDPELREQVEEIVQAATQGASLTRQLLAFTRVQLLSPVVLDPNEAVAGVRKLLSRLIGEDVEIVLDLKARSRIRSDPGQIEQLVLNLAVNARDAMPRGGKLIIETADAELAPSTRGRLGAPPGPYVMIAVTDDGVGMDEETQARLFEPFFTTKAAGAGTGLGLSVVWGIVKGGGGDIHVYSSPGRGTTFKIYLPRVGELPAEAAAAAAPSATSAKGSESILLVEDNDLLRSVAARTLRHAGYRVTLAANAREALAVLGTDERIDLLLTDVVMPEVSGPELAERAVALRGPMRVLFMSGYTGTALAHQKILDIGAPYLQKPFTPEGLLRAVRGAIDAPEDL